MSEICMMVNANTCLRNRYLILDVLGQGTFGQVVKCQNLKTQEVVAVKVVKNRTAYFNQSMMEVSVLDLVSIPLTIPNSLLTFCSSTPNSIRTTIIISFD
jgi:serine/threonine protein kinase